MAGGQGKYSHNVWNRQELLRVQKQDAAIEKAVEREHKLQQTAAGKDQAAQLNVDLAAQHPT
jgi:hypothetical protein